MPDPASLIALGAAIGGAAGKLAERTWDSSERWLRERFGSHSKEVKERARVNAAHFVEHLISRVEVLEQQHQIHAEQVNVQSHPEFSALLQRSLINAAQTEDEIKQDLLASLVASRLGSNAETTFALASQLASDAIARSTRRQLQLMALCCFLKEIRLQYPISPAHYRLWLELHLRPFEHFQFNEGDAWHLVAIACASYDPSSTLDLTVLLQMKGEQIGLEDCFSDLIDVEVLQSHWDQGLAGVSLTSVGSIVGGLALEQLAGKKYGQPKWF